MAAIKKETRPEKVKREKDALDSFDDIFRDVKGLYRKAIAGEIKHFTGVSDTYEPPLSPDLIIETDKETIGESVEKIIDELSRRQLIR